MSGRIDKGGESMQFITKGLGIVTDDEPAYFTGIKLASATKTSDRVLYIRSRFVRNVDNYEPEFDSTEPVVKYIADNKRDNFESAELTLYKVGSPYKSLIITGASTISLDKYIARYMLCVLEFLRVSISQYPNITVLHGTDDNQHSNSESIYVDTLDFGGMDEFMLDGNDVILALSKNYARCRMIRRKWMLEGKFGIYQNRVYVLANNGMLYSLDKDGTFRKIELTLIQANEFIDSARYIRKRKKRNYVQT
jgi:hypothetical protein